MSVTHPEAAALRNLKKEVWTLGLEALRSTKGPLLRSFLAAIFPEVAIVIQQAPNIVPNVCDGVLLCFIILASQ